MAEKLKYFQKMSCYSRNKQDKCVIFAKKYLNESI